LTAADAGWSIFEKNSDHGRINTKVELSWWYAGRINAAFMDNT
jgi:hypothetical protein